MIEAILLALNSVNEKVIRVAGSDDRGWARCLEDRNLDRRSDSCHLGDKGARDPDVAVGSRGNGTGRIYPAKLSDHSARRDPAEFVHCLLGKPHVTIRARGDVARERIRCRCRKLRKNAGRGIVPPNGMIGLISKPILPSEPVVIPTLTPKKENWISVIAAIRDEPGGTDAIFPVDPSPNQMLPSGPGVLSSSQPACCKAGASWDCSMAPCRFHAAHYW